MKSSILKGHVDLIGRVVLPIEFRRELNIPLDKDSKVYISVPDEEGIYTVITEALQPNATITAVIGLLIIPKAYELKDCLLDLWIEEGNLRIKKTVPQCRITGDTENLIRYKNTDKYLSEEVIRSMYELLLINNA